MEVQTMTLPPKPAHTKFNDAQWQAIHQRGGNILVAASAGSGKTAVLIERIFSQIVQDQVDISRLLVVTFTEAAAKEMKDRMEARLKSAINQTQPGPHQAYLLSQVHQLPQAHIQTLHSFCLQVIGRYFYLVDFDPDVQLETDESKLLMLYEKAWEAGVTAIIQDQAPMEHDDYLALLEIYANHRSDASLFQLVHKIYSFSQAQPDPEDWIASLAGDQSLGEELFSSPLFEAAFWDPLPSLIQDLAFILDQARPWLTQLSHEKILIYQDYLHQLDQILAGLDRVYQEGDRVSLYNYWVDLDLPKWPRASGSSEDRAIIAEIKVIRDSFEEQIKSYRQLFSLPVSEQLRLENQAYNQVRALKSLVKIYGDQVRAQKAARGVIDYYDLEHLALNILAPKDDQGQRQASEAGRFYQDHFHEVLIDEYQDINEIQDQILYWLSRQTSPKPNNRFMVGDIKQSIYGFRMADPQQFLSKYLAYGDSDQDQLIILNQSYRSRREVLDFINYTFERIMDLDVGGMEYGPDQGLIAGFPDFLPPPVHPDFSINWLLFDQEKTGQKLDLDPAFSSSLSVEADRVARDIQDRVGRMQIYDKDLQACRPLNYQDIVILASTRQALLEFERALDGRNIPNLAQKSDQFFQRYEVQIMVALLQIIDNPDQDLPLVAVLRSFFLGLSDDQLAQIRIPHKEGSYYQALLAYAYGVGSDPQLQEKIQAFLKQVHVWRQASQEKTMAQLIWQIYMDSHFIAFVQGLSHGDQRQANLHALYQRAESFDGQRNRGLSDFIHYIQNVLDRDKDLAEPLMVTSQQDVVRLMTVHASKGLEFPVVYLVNCSREFNETDLRGPVVLSKTHGLGTAFYDISAGVKVASLVQEAIKIENRHQDRAEEMRKLYVALTRCEQKLIVSASVSSQADWQADLDRIQDRTPSQQVLADKSSRQKARSWLTWLQAAYAQGSGQVGSFADFHKDQIQLEFYTQDQVLQDRPHTWQVKKDPLAFGQALEAQLADPGIPISQDLANLMDYNYPYQLASRTASYQSVSELKRLYEEPFSQQLAYFQDRRPQEDLARPDEGIQSLRYTLDTFQAPSFVQETRTLTPAEKGSITHYVMQALDFDSFQGRKIAEELDRQVQALVQNGSLDSQHLAGVDRQQLASFLASPLGQEMVQQGADIQRERAFSFLLPAKDVFGQELGPDLVKELAEDQVLVHGIIDAYYKSPRGWVLLDYKTDRYRTGLTMTQQDQVEALKNKYRFQLSMYAAGLQASLQTPIQEIYLVLLDFNEVVALEDPYRLN